MLLFVTCNKDKGHDSILGQWKCEEYRESGENSQFVVSISRDVLASDTVSYVISNFYKLGTTNEALVRFKLSADGTITIPNQIVMQTNISGTGNVESNFSKINLTYDIQSTKFNGKVVATFY